jgi:hypothetical protein
MSKTRRKYNGSDDLGFEYQTRQSHKDKRRERRFERALRVKNVDDLTAEEGLDPVLDFENTIDDELLEIKHANV